MRRLPLLLAIVAVASIVATSTASAAPRHCTRTIDGRTWKITLYSVSCHTAAHWIKKFDHWRSEPRGWRCTGSAAAGFQTCVTHNRRLFTAHLRH